MHFPRFGSHIAYALIIITGASSFSITTYDGGLINSLNAVPSYLQHFNLTAALIGLNAALVSAGCVVAGPFIGPIVDKWGRKKGLAFGAGISVLAVVLEASAATEAQFAVGRFLVGVSTVISTSVSVIWVTEMASPTNRAVLTGIMFTVAPIASAVVVAIILGTYSMTSNWGWRIPVLMEAFLPMVTLILLLFVDESPRWLVSQGSDDEALEILARLHFKGDGENELLRAEFRAIRDTIDFEIAHQGSWGSLIKPAGNLRRFSIAVLTNIFFQIAGPNTVLYFLTLIIINTGITDTRNVLLVTFGTMVWNVIWVLVGTYLIQNFGRKKAFVYGTSVITISFALLAGLVYGYEHTGKLGFSIAAILVVALLEVAADCSWMIVGWAYPAEVLCYTQRAKGATVAQSIGWAFSFLNLYTTPIALKNVSWRYYVINGGWNVVIIAIIIFFFVETKGRSLEEIDEIFDGVIHTDEVVISTGLNTQGPGKFARASMKESVPIDDGELVSQK